MKAWIDAAARWLSNCGRRRPDPPTIQTDGIHVYDPSTVFKTHGCVVFNQDPDEPIYLESGYSDPGQFGIVEYFDASGPRDACQNFAPTESPPPA